MEDLFGINAGHFPDWGPCPNQPDNERCCQNKHDSLFFHGKSEFRYERQDEWGEKPVYSSTMYIRPDTITRIVPLDPARVDKVKKELLRPAKPPQRPGVDRADGIEI